MAVVRSHPDTPCPPTGAHHPHRHECTESCCELEWEENGLGEWVWTPGLWCCVCGQAWPCETKRQHEQERRDRAAASRVPV